jgi:hypothetical protein
VIRPIPDGIRVTQEYGLTAFARSSGAYPTPGHLGMDFATPMNTPLVAPAEGLIEHVGFGDLNSWGYYVKLSDGARGHVFAHLKAGSAKVKVGDEVREGQVMAATGNTGWSTGPHLHWQVTDPDEGTAAMHHAIDPRTLLDPDRYTTLALQDYATMAALRHGLDPQIFLRQINQESGWQVYAHSGAGAIGIAQIVPRWHPSVNPWRPHESLDYAGGLVAGHLREFGRIDLALAAYNAGSTAVREWGGIPPYPETQNYVKSILNDWSPPVFDDMHESQAIDKWLHLQFQALAQEVTGVVNRANAGVMPTPEEVEHANKRFAELRDNWSEMWAKEKAAVAAGKDN